jgi:hypothetical protein
MEVEMMNWVWLYIPAAIFLAFSAALWLVVKHADTEPDAGGADRMAPARATVARDAAGSAASLVNH